MHARRTAALGVAALVLTAAGTALADPPPSATFAQSGFLRHQSVLAISGDGHTAVVPVPTTAKVHVWRDTGGSWHQTPVSLGIPTTTSSLSSSAALSGDGRTLALDTLGGTDSHPFCVLQVFHEDAGHWAQTFGLDLTRTPATYCSSHVALSADGLALALWAGTDNPIQLYRLGAAGWTIDAAVPSPPQHPQVFYFEVLLDGTGSVIVTVPDHQLNSDMSAWVTREADGWPTPTVLPGAQAVAFASLSRDGRTIAVTQESAADAGAHPTVEVLHDAVGDGTWRRTATFAPGTVPDFRSQHAVLYGRETALSANGDTVLVGSDALGAVTQVAGGNTVVGPYSVYRYVQQGGTWHWGGLIRSPVAAGTSGRYPSGGMNLLTTADARRVLLSRPPSTSRDLEYGTVVLDATG